jgi:butyrate kinase
MAEKEYMILVVNPGSTSTKIGLFCSIAHASASS